jgi:hypothetical protein
MHSMVTNSISTKPDAVVEVTLGLRWLGFRRTLQINGGRNPGAQAICQRG